MPPTTTLLRSLPPKKVVATATVAVAYILSSHRSSSIFTTASPWSFLPLLSLLATVELFAWLARRLLLYPKLFSPLRHLPGPDGNHWLNGQWKRISKEPSGYPQTDWINNIPNDGIIRYLSLGNGERIMITSAKGLSEVLTTKAYDFEKPAFFRHGLGRLLGIGILLADGDEHKAQRKNLAPAFAFRHIKNLTPLFWEKSKQGVTILTKEVQSLWGEASSGDDEAEPPVVEVNEWASRMTLDIIGQAGVGVDFGAIENPNTPLSATYRAVFQPTKAQTMLQLLGLFFPYWIVNRIPIKRNADVAAASTLIRSTVRDLIQEKKRYREKKEAPADIDILGVALESGGFEDENLVDQMMTFLAAGHETTASALTWAVYLMCCHPEMQQRLRDEVRAHLPSPLNDTNSRSPSSVTSQDMDQLPFLHAFCNEVLRYFPPVPVTVRVAARDTTIAGHAIPQGTSLFLVARAVNMCEAFWGPTARTFDPERWMASPTGGATSNYAMMTFLHGPRGCIGQGFAKAEFACLLATWVGRFEFTLRDEKLLDEKNLTVKGAVTTKQAGGLFVKTRVVEGW